MDILVKHIFPGLLPLPFRHVSLVNYPAGSSGDHHRHDCFQLVAVQKGRIAFQLSNGLDIEIGGGEIMVIPPVFAHNWSIPEEAVCESVQVLFEPLSVDTYGSLGRIFSETNREWWRTRVPTEAIDTVFELLLSECMEPRPAASAMVAGHLLVLLAEVERSAHRNDSFPDTTFPEPVRRALDYIEASYTEPIRLDELAQVACLGISRFSQLFREQTGYAPMRYVQRRKMKQAEVLLAYGKLNVGEIAEHLGFHSIHHFSRLFKQHAQVSPTAFRQATEGNTAPRK